MAQPVECSVVIPCDRTEAFRLGIEPKEKRRAANHERTQPATAQAGKSKPAGAPTLSLIPSKDGYWLCAALKKDCEFVAMSGSLNINAPVVFVIARKRVQTDKSADFSIVY